MKTESKHQDELEVILRSVKWTTVIDQLSPTSVFTIDPSSSKFIDIYVDAGHESFINIVKKSVFNIIQDKHPGVDIPSAFVNLKIKIQREKLLMHDIDADFENAVVCFDTTIIATDSPKTYIKHCKLVCPKCGYGFSVSCDKSRNEFS